ncbi:uncharacterized protein LOC107615158 [Arachis ipaensis]|uniref:uncharacterized protein LOC107615158 n=1 Tax=Arachis ipaensis TaxID=130454 RepID=UPI0007AF2FD4|nr:uncharacterized protein LOC107615158 [Arachis ipaensis]
MERGESGGESSRVAHSEAANHAGESNKGESGGGHASGEKEGIKGDNNKIQGQRISFRDKVVGASTRRALEVADSLDGDKMATVVGKQGDSEIPTVTFTEEAKEILVEPYKDAIVVKVLGKNFSYTAITHRLKGVWRTKGGYEVLDVGFDYFLVKFDLLEDREKVLLGGPWMITGSYVMVKPWSSSFRPCENTFGSTMVWIRITGLNINYYQERAVKMIVSAVGKPIRIDLATKSAEREKYARACVQINLGLPVIKKIQVDGHMYDIEYEHLNLICEKCSCFGHVTRECAKENNGIGKETMVKEKNLLSLFPVDNNEKTAEGSQIPVKNQNSTFEFGINAKSIPIMEKHGEAGLVCDNLQESRMDRDTQAKEGEWVTVSRKGKEKVGKGPNVVPKRVNVAICSNLVSKKFSFGSNNMHAGSSSNAKVKSLSNVKVEPKEKKDPPSTLGSLGTIQVAFKDQSTPFFKAGHKRQRSISLQNSPTEVLSTDSRVQKELDKASATINLENQPQQKNDGSAVQVHQKTIGDRSPST